MDSVDLRLNQYTENTNRNALAKSGINIRYSCVQKLKQWKDYSAIILYRWIKN